jgi:hypothetical protein
MENIMITTFCYLHGHEGGREFLRRANYEYEPGTFVFYEPANPAEATDSRPFLSWQLLKALSRAFFDPVHPWPGWSSLSCYTVNQAVVVLGLIGNDALAAWLCEEAITRLPYAQPVYPERPAVLIGSPTWWDQQEVA